MWDWEMKFHGFSPFKVAKEVEKRRNWVTEAVLGKAGMLSLLSTHSVLDWKATLNCYWFFRKTYKDMYTACKTNDNSEGEGNGLEQRSNGHFPTLIQLPAPSPASWFQIAFGVDHRYLSVSIHLAFKILSPKWGNLHRQNMELCDQAIPWLLSHIMFLSQVLLELFGSSCW